MSSFVLPMTVRTAAGDVHLAVDVHRPTALAMVLPQLLQSAGLPADTVLNLGFGPVEGSWALGRTPLLAGTVLSTEPQDDVAATGPVNLSCVAGPDAGSWVALDRSAVVVGRDPNCDLTLDDPELSRRHAEISWSDEGVTVTDLDSANGVHLDGCGQVDPGPGPAAANNVLIRLGGSVLRTGLDTEPCLLLTPDGAGRLAVSRPARVTPDFAFPMAPEVGAPPERGRRPIPLLAALIGAVAGAVVALVTGMWMFLLLAALGPVMMLATAASDRISGRRSHRRAVADHRRATAADARLCTNAVAADRIDAWDRYPDPATLARRAVNCSTRLWERRPAHPDFLRVCLGVGSRPARVQRDEPPIVDEVPITLGIGQIGVLGLAGECRPLLRHLIAQLAGLHSPAELHLSTFSTNPDLARSHLLPHAAVDGSAELLTTGTPADAETRIRRLLHTDDGRTCVVVLDDAHAWRRVAGMTDLLTVAAGTFGPGGLAEPFGPAGRPDRSRFAGRRIVVLCVAPRPEELPVECTAVATVRDGVVEVAAGSIAVRAEAAGVSARYLDAAITALAPLADPDAPGAGLPREVALSELLGGRRIQDAVRSGWQHPALATPVGIGPGGPITIDLERDGPHLLVAGTTGSGKSELLQTLIAGLACAAPPDRTAFLLIDYKGGAAFGRLAALPHTTGLVTDLDAALAARALASLRAEVRHREQVLAEAGANDLAELRGRVGGFAPPFLVIVVDEFATLAVELPQFLTGLLDVVQRGRSLGLHLVLATQRPAGVLSPAMKANIGLRICLRVTDDADSVDVIDTADAARLSSGLAGRAMLRHERSRITAFQVARVSGISSSDPVVRLLERPAGEPPALGAPMTGDPAISTPDPAPGRAPDPAHGVTCLDEIVEATSAAAEGSPRPAPPWLPALPRVYRPADADPAERNLVALLDRPADQQQIGLCLPAGSTMVLGPPGSGRTTALRRFGWAAAAAGAQLLVVDANQSLGDLARWPAVRSHLDGQDPTLVQRLVQQLHAELRRRAGTPAEPVLLLLDGWEVIAGPLDALDYGASVAALGDLAARGPGSGIRVVLSGDLRLEHHRMTGSFPNVVRFGVTERGDVAPGPPGRGRFGPDEIQGADCPSGTAAPDVEPARTPGIEVRELPGKIHFDDLPQGHPGAVPVGLGGDAAELCALDLTGPGGGLLVAGPRRSGVSTTLTLLAATATAADVPVLRACVRPVAPVPASRRAACRAVDVDVRLGFHELRSRLVDHCGPLLLIADDADSWSEEGQDLLERFVTVAGTGQYVALGARLDRAIRCHRGPIAEVAALRTGILLHGDSADGSLLDTVLPRRRGQLPAGRGHLVVAGHAVPLQVAYL